MRNWFRNWIGITALEEDQLLIEQQLKDIKGSLNKINEQLAVIGPGLGRVIAKLDAKYAESEHSAERRAESDKLGEEVLKRLEAEAKARAPYNQSWNNGAD